jgi:DNA-binding CsgD family transcriptional regulator
MMSSGLLSERDLRALISVVEDGRRDAPGPGLPWVVLDHLRGLVGCDELSFTELDLRRHGRPLAQGVFATGEREVIQGEECEDPDSDPYWRLYRNFLPCHGPKEMARPRVSRWSDFYTSTPLRNAPLYAEYFSLEPDAIKHSMTAELPTLPDQTRRLLFRRYDGCDFSDRDKLVLEVLWPHLYEVFQDAELRRAGVPQLTPREWEILQLAARGNSNADIARLLFVSVSTVRKHMEHIFDRTGVRSRGAAVARLMPRLAPVPGGGTLSRLASRRSVSS